MNTVQVTITDPSVLPVVSVDWDTGVTTVAQPTAVVNIPVGVGVPGKDGAAQFPSVIDGGNPFDTTGA